MIDNPLQADLLMAKLKAALPLPALATPPMLAQLHEQAPDLDLSPQCQITGIHYAGDEGGILCKITFGRDDPKGFFVSITHLTSHGHFGVKFMIAASWGHPSAALRDPRSKPFA